jgi:hypothetical protein
MGTIKREILYTTFNWGERSVNYERCICHMGKKKEKEIDLNNLKPEEIQKYETAEELGYLDKVMATGWSSLTAKESGRIGGILASKRREVLAKKAAEDANKTGGNE